jgi:hypothetical protein
MTTTNPAMSAPVAVLDLQRLALEVEEALSPNVSPAAMWILQKANQ